MERIILPYNNTETDSIFAHVISIYLDLKSAKSCEPYSFQIKRIFAKIKASCRRIFFFWKKKKGWRRNASKQMNRPIFLNKMGILISYLGWCSEIWVESTLQMSESFNVGLLVLKLLPHLEPLISFSLFYMELIWKMHRKNSQTNTTFSFSWVLVIWKGWMI